MERNREMRRADIVGSNGFNRRRHRTLRESPDEEGGLELQESVRLRDRTKKDRERDRDRDRDRERERERVRDLRERPSRSKRRRVERLISNRDGVGGDETSDESLNDDDYEDDEDATATRLIPPPASSAISNHTIHSSLHRNNMNNIISSNYNLQHRKSFPPSSSSNVFRAAPIWKPNEIINVSVPRKARSASTKRSHDWASTSSNNNSGGGGEQVHQQASTSPARQGGASASTPSPAAPMSPPCSSTSPLKKKLKSGGSNCGQMLRQPKAAEWQSSSNPEELEIEIAEVLYGLMTQSQAPSSTKDDSREVDKSNGDVKPNVSSPICNSNLASKQILRPNCSPIQLVATKRQKTRQTPDNLSYGDSVKLDMDKPVKSEISSPNLEKMSVSNGENVSETGETSSSQGPPMAALSPEPTSSASIKMNCLELKAAAEGLKESRDLAVKKDMSSPKDKKSTAVRNDNIICVDTIVTATASIKANALVYDAENQKQRKLEIDLMARPPQVRSSPEREIKIHFKATPMAADHKSSLSICNTELKMKDKVDEKRKIGKEQPENEAVEESKEKRTVEEAGLTKGAQNKVTSVVDVQLDLEMPVRNGNTAVYSSANKLQLYNDKQQQQEMPCKPNREEPLSVKSSQSKSSLPSAVPMASWPGGLPPLGYVAPLQGVVSMDGSTVTAAPVQPLFSEPRPKKCATHSYIARSIQRLQHVMKMNPFWHAAAGSASFFGSKPGNLNLMHADLHGNVAGRGVNTAPDKGNDLASNPNSSGRVEGSQTASISDSGQRKQPILMQQALPPAAATSFLGIFPLNQQQAKSASDPSASAGASASVAAAMSFSYPAMAANETQYLAILQNNAYPFPIHAVGAPPNYRGNPAPFNGSFYSSQMIHPAQLQHQLTPSVQSPQLQQRRPQSGGANGGAGTATSQDFPGPKSQQSQQWPRHFDGELGTQGSPSTTDSRGSRASSNIYGRNFTMPIHPHNFAIMTPSISLASAVSASGSSNISEKQLQNLSQHGFAMSVGTVNGANMGPGIDVTSMAQNHATGQNIQMMAASAAADQAQKKHFRVSEDDESGVVSDSVTSYAERKSLTSKAQGGEGQSIAFSRSDSVNAPVSSAQANSANVIQSSGRPLNVASGTARSSGPSTANSHIQDQLQQQQLATTGVNWVTAPGAGNGSSSSSTAAKFPAGFHQNFVECSTGSSQSPQWRSSTMALVSQAPHSRSPAPMQTQISFRGNHKPSSSQGQAPASGNGAPSPPIMIGSPTTSSISRGASGSPKPTSASVNTRSIPNQKSSSILGQPHVTSSSSSGLKHPQQKQSLSQQPPPMTMQQTQLFFSNPYSQAQSAHLTSPSSTTATPGGFYTQRRQADQQQQSAQQPLVVPPTPSTRTLTVCPSTTRTSSSTTMNDPAKAIAAATANVNAAPLPSQGIINTGNHLPASLSYPHPVPAAVQVKPAEQKQPAG